MKQKEEKHAKRKRALYVDHHFRLKYKIFENPFHSVWNRMNAVLFNIIIVIEKVLIENYCYRKAFNRKLLLSKNFL